MYSDRLFTYMVQNAPVPIFAVDSNNRIIVWNEECEKLTGVMRQQVISSDSYASHFPNIQFPGLFEKVFRNDSAEDENLYNESSIGCSAEGVLIDAEGKSLYVQVRAVPVVESDNRVSAVIMYIEDITSWKNMEWLLSNLNRAEEALERSRDNYLVVFEEFPALIWRAGLNAKCDYFNKGWLDFTGRTLAQEVGDGWAEGVHKDDMDRCLAIYLEAFHARRAFDMEYRLRRYDGEYRWIVDYGRPFYNSEGEFAGYIGSCYDVTDRKQTEEELKEQKAFVESVIENSFVPTFVIDKSHRVMVWNRACEELTGIKAADLMGTDLHWKAFYSFKRPCLADLVIDRRLDQAKDYYIECSESLRVKGGVHSESWFPNLGDRERYMVFDAAPVYNHKGQIVAAIETFRDITDRKRMEVALREKNQRIISELEMASKIQRELLPKKLPDSINISVAWEFLPCVYVAGDGLDVFQLNDRYLGFYIFDVMGHGVTAALKSVTLYYMFRDLVKTDNWETEGKGGEGFSPARTLNSLNARFCESFSQWNFFTAFYGILDLESYTLTYARAGHCRPLIINGTSEIRELAQGGPAVGFLNCAAYRDFAVSLKKGDKLLMYTDGIIEAENSDNEQFSKSRLVCCVDRNRTRNIKDLLRIIRDDVLTYVSPAETADDVTLLGIEIA